MEASNRMLISQSDDTQTRATNPLLPNPKSKQKKSYRIRRMISQMQFIEKEAIKVAIIGDK